MRTKTADLPARKLKQAAWPWEREIGPHIYLNRESISICSVHFHFSSSAFSNSSSAIFCRYVCSLENNLLETFLIASKLRSKLNIKRLSVPFVPKHSENGVKNLVMDHHRNEFL